MISSCKALRSLFKEEICEEENSERQTGNYTKLFWH